MMRSNTLEATNYNFTSPYPQPQYGYPTAHSRTSLPQNNSRSPSPTPSEIEEANQPFIPRKLFSLEFYKRPKVILWVVVFILFGILSVLITIYHKQIEDWLRPAATWVQKLKFGFLIPIAILFVISFPPLFGHEIVAVLCGNVWGLWEGFGIVCAGTLLGEIGNFYAFKYLCTARGDKLERESFFYGCLARSVREGGFLVAVMARLSVIPGHFTTAVFATCGMNIFVFILAAILSLPKQFVTVYLAVLLEQSSDNTESGHQKLISDLVVVASIVITSAAMWYILNKMKKYRLAVVRDRRKRAAGAAGMRPYDEEGRVPLTSGRGHQAGASTSSLVSNDVFNPGISDAELAGQPMTVGYDGYRTGGYSVKGEPFAPKPQRWDERGKAIDMQDMQDDHYSRGYDDPYEYNSYPPSFQTPTSSPLISAKNQVQQQTYTPPRSPPPRLRPQTNPAAAGNNLQPQQRTFSPPPGPPPGTAYQPMAASPSMPPLPVPVPVPAPVPPSSSSASTVPSAPPPSYTTAPLAPPSIAVGQHDSPQSFPGSPFEDVNAIQIPAHVKRYQLSDGSNDFRSSQAFDKEHNSGEESTKGHLQEATESTFYSAHSRSGTSDVDLR